MKNSIKKYCLALIFMFMGLFMINIDVYAESYSDIICEYNFAWGDQYTFLLSYTDGQWAVGGDAVNFALDYNKTQWHNFGDASSCPKVTVYKRAAALDNWDRFYVLDQNFFNQCKQKQKEEGKLEVTIDGYKCNKIRDFTGTKKEDIKQKCPKDIQDKIIADLEVKYKPITSKFNTFSNQLLHSSINAAGLNKKSDVDNKCNQLNIKAEEYKQQMAKEINSLDVPADVIEELKKYSCQIPDKTNIENYFKNKFNPFGANLLANGRTAYNTCVRSSALSETQKQELIDGKKGEVDKKIEEWHEYVLSTIETWIKRINSITMGELVEVSCEGILGDELIAFINKLFNYIKVIAPILLIILGSVDFGQAVLTDDKDALKKATSKFIKRAIICVAIFFLPLVVNFLLNLIDGMGKDPLCGIK